MIVQKIPTEQFLKELRTRRYLPFHDVQFRYGMVMVKGRQRCIHLFGWARDDAALQVAVVMSKRSDNPHTMLR